ncbi:MAG: succinate dehydrogenase/fumarate reductase iron-sulfur subunit [Actinomycetia bacterium]|nr:succinate dehydrogenase/fumarate reductase iron-sulfur subunit [Actinomycetes bacterium]
MSATGADTITIWIWRGTREAGGEQPYPVELQPGMVVLDAVHYVQAHHAPDLAVRWNCKAAHCGSCGAEVNGRPRLLCKTRLDDYVRRGEEVHVRPMKTFPVVRDLVPDVSWNYRTARRIPAFAPRGTAPFRLWQRDVDRVQEFRRCIECFLCQDVCHVLREHGLTDRYMGPRYLLKLAERAMSPVDQADRIPFVKHEGGVDWCNVTRCCSEVCPEGIEITNNAIIPLKERVADRYWDPVRRLVRRARRRPDLDPA